MEVVGRGLASHRSPSPEDDVQVDPYCHYRTHDGCARTGTDLHPSLACTRKCHQRLLAALGVRHQSWLCQNSRGELRSCQATSPSATTTRQAQAVGAECQSTPPASRKTV